MSNQFGRLSQVAPIGIEQPQAVPLVPTQHPPANLAHFFSTLAPHQLVLVDPMGLLGGFMPFTPVSTPAQVGHQIASSDESHLEQVQMALAAVQMVLVKQGGLSTHG
jgi:hypothetical protein